MQHVTSNFLDEVRGSHRMLAYCDVIATTGQKFTLPIMGGNVTIDRTATIRRSCSLECVDPTFTLTPKTAKSVLTPYGTVIKPYRGVIYEDGPLAGTSEVVSLGIFRLANISVTDTGAVQIHVEGFDLSRMVQRDAFTDVYTIPQGYNVVQAVQDIINRTVDDVHYDLTTSSLTTPAPVVYDASTDPWAAAQSLAASAGMEVFFKASGRVKIAPPTDIDHLPSPVFSFAEGGNSMLSVSRVFDDASPGQNGVILVGETAGSGTTPPVRSVQWDTNPNSPTYYLGPYGQVPMFVTDNIVATQADADAAAIAQLNLVLGFLDQVAMSTVVNPALEPDDVVEVVRLRLGLNAAYAISSITIPMDNDGKSTVTMRQLRTRS